MLLMKILQRKNTFDNRPLIFASPIQEICPGDPFGGKSMVPSENVPSQLEESLNLPVLTRLRRSWTDREPASYRSAQSSTRQASKYESGVSFPPYDGMVVDKNSSSTQVFFSFIYF